jgi:hypothetical protein
MEDFIAGAPGRSAPVDECRDPHTAREVVPPAVERRRAAALYVVGRGCFPAQERVSRSGARDRAATALDM